MAFPPFRGIDALGDDLDPSSGKVAPSKAFNGVPFCSIGPFSLMGS